MSLRTTTLGFAALLCASPAGAAAVTARINAPFVVGESVEFAANGVGTGQLEFTWDFGDGERSTPSATGVAHHSYTQPGHYPVIVTVRDESGARSDSFLQVIHRPLPETPPSSSSTIVHHRALKRICNVNADNDSVSCLATDTLDLVFEAPVGKHPRTLTVAPDDTLWVTNQDDASISIVDAEGNERDVIGLPYASRPFGIVVSAHLGKAFVSLQARGEVVEIDLETRRIERTVQVGPSVAGLALDARSSRLYVSRFISADDGGEVAEIETKRLRVTRRFRLPLDPGPDTEASARGVPNYLRAVVPSPDGARLWVPAKKDNISRGSARDGLPLTFETSVRTIVSFLDPTSGEEILEERIDLNNRTLGLSATFSPLGDYAFVALLGNDGVEAIDAYNRRVVAGQFELGSAPDGLVLDDAGRLYLNAFLARSVVVLDVTQLLESRAFTFERVADVKVSLQESLDPDVLRGKQIFYDASDTRMSRDGYISCAACHLDGFEDGQIWDFTDRGEGFRNTTSLLGRRGMGHGRVHWSGNFDEIQDFEHDMRGPFGGTGFLSQESFEEGSRSTTLGDAKAGKSAELDALAAYVTSLDRVHTSPHRDRDGSLTDAGWRGRALFESSGCTTCHGGPDFTDSLEGRLHDVGTLRSTSGKRLGEALSGIDTPTLRGIWETAPYLHDGSAGTLLDVIARNSSDQHGNTSSLSDGERADLVAYLMQIDNVALEDEVEPEPASEREPDVTRGGCNWGESRPRSAPLSFVLALSLTAAWRARRRRFE